MRSFVPNAIFEGSGGIGKPICQLTQREAKVAIQIGLTVLYGNRHMQPPPRKVWVGKKEVLARLPHWSNWPKKRFAYVEVKNREESKSLMQKIRAAFP